MHPQVREEKPGDCPICHMQLVLEGAKEVHAEKQATLKSYFPLIVIIGLIFLTSVCISLREFSLGTFSFTNWISHFMAGFFIVFAGFKLMDLKGFAQGYATYDLLAKRWYSYGYIYPFLELLFGVSMILTPESTGILLLELFIMIFSGVGVALKLKRHEKFQCACLGTFIKVPLTKVTLVEDFGMALFALLMLLLR